MKEYNFRMFVEKTRANGDTIVEQTRLSVDSNDPLFRYMEFCEKVNKAVKKACKAVSAGACNDVKVEIVSTIWEDGHPHVNVWETRSADDICDEGIYLPPNYQNENPEHDLFLPADRAVDGMNF